MIQTKLVNLVDIQQYKQVSNTVYTEVLNSIIIDSQIQDVAPLLGELLFNDILNNVGNYTALLDGGTYNYNGVTYTNYGLKAVISYYVYARYVYYGSNIDNPFSFTEKLSGNDSRPTSEKTKKDLYQLNRDSAFKIWGSVQNYLIRTNNELYNNVCINKKNRSFNISKIV